MAKKVLIFISVLAVIFLPGYIQIRKLAAKEKELQVRIKQLKKDNARLQEETLRLKNDPFYIEKIAREKYGLVKKGETVYNIEP